MESTSSLLKVLQIILTDVDTISLVSDAAFDAVDVDGSGFLEREDLSTVMKNVALDMKVKPPTEAEVEALLKELDEDFDDKVSKAEFVKLIEMVLRKMLESEEDLQNSINMNRAS